MPPAKVGHLAGSHNAAKINSHVRPFNLGTDRQIAVIQTQLVRRFDHLNNISSPTIAGDEGGRKIEYVELFHRD